jgi:hypothetical protein
VLGARNYVLVEINRAKDPAPSTQHLLHLFSLSLPIILTQIKFSEYK